MGKLDKKNPKALVEACVGYFLEGNDESRSAVQEVFVSLNDDEKRNFLIALISDDRVSAHDFFQSFDFKVHSFLSIAAPFFPILISQRKSDFLEVIFQEARNCHQLTEMLSANEMFNLLFAAMEQGDEQAVQVILTYAADQDEKEQTSLFTPLVYARNQKGHEPLSVGLMADKTEAVIAFFEVLKRRNRAEFQRLMSDVEVQPLHMAIERRQYDLVEYLLNAAVECDPEHGLESLLLTSLDRPSPLFFAVESGDQKIVQMIVNAVRNEQPRLIDRLFSSQDGFFSLLFKAIHQEQMLETLWTLVIDVMAEGDLPWVDQVRLESVLDSAIEKKRPEIIGAFFKRVDAAENKEQLLKGMLCDSVLQRGETLSRKKVTEVLVCLNELNEVQYIKDVLAIVQSLGGVKEILVEPHHLSEVSYYLSCDHPLGLLKRALLKKHSDVLHEMLEVMQAASKQRPLLFSEGEDAVVQLFLLAIYHGNQKGMEQLFDAIHQMKDAQDRIEWVVLGKDLPEHRKRMVSAIVEKNDEEMARSFLEKVRCYDGVLSSLIQEQAESMAHLFVLFCDKQEHLELIESQLFPNENRCKVLKEAAQQGDKKTVALLLTRAAEIDHRREDENASLSTALLKDILPNITDYCPEVRAELRDALTTLVRNGCITPSNCNDDKLQLMQHHLVDHIEYRLRTERQEIETGRKEQQFDTIFFKTELEKKQSQLSQFIDHSKSFKRYFSQTPARQKLESSMSQHEFELSRMALPDKRREEKGETGCNR